MSTCPKCAGLLVSAPSSLLLATDYHLDTSDLNAGMGPSVTCLNCGYYADAVSLANRAKQAQARRAIDNAEAIATWATFTTQHQAA